MTSELAILFEELAKKITVLVENNQAMKQQIEFLDDRILELEKNEYKIDQLEFDMKELKSKLGEDD